jgi:hypothetical protein
VRPYAQATLDNLAWEINQLGVPSSGYTMVPYALLLELYKIAAVEGRPQPAWERAFAAYWNARTQEMTPEQTHIAGLYLLLAILLIGSSATTVAAVVVLTFTGLFALAQDVIGLVVIPLVFPLMLGLFLRRTAAWAGLAGLAVCLLFTVVNCWGFAWLGWNAPFSFEAEISPGALLTLVVTAGSGLLPRAGRARVD